MATATAPAARTFEEMDPLSRAGVLLGYERAVEKKVSGEIRGASNSAGYREARADVLRLRQFICGSPQAGPI